MHSCVRATSRIDRQHSENSGDGRTSGMAIRVCVAGATGWAGASITRHILASTDFMLAGAVARQQAGSDAGAALGLPHSGIRIAGTVAEALQAPTDVLIDYTRPDAVKAHTLAALAAGVRVVIGTSGLTAADYAEIDQAAKERNLGVIAAGDFLLTPAPAEHFALIAGQDLPPWELLAHAPAPKIRAPPR